MMTPLIELEELDVFPETDDCPLVIDAFSPKTAHIIDFITGRALPLNRRPTMARLRSERQLQSWTSKTRHIVETMSFIERERLARFWLKIALDKHASMISFQQLAMEFMVFAAPVALIRSAQEASQKELHLAERAFSLTAGYLGQDMRPDNISYQPKLHESQIELAESIALLDLMNPVFVCSSLSAAPQSTGVKIIDMLMQDLQEMSRHHINIGFKALQWSLITGGPAVRARLGSIFSSPIHFDVGGCKCLKMADCEVLGQKSYKAATVMAKREIREMGERLIQAGK